MPGFTGVVAAACLGVSLTGLAFGIDADRDFTGHWILDAAASDTRALGVPPERELNVSQLDIVLSCSSPSDDGAKSVDWFYSLTGARAEYKIGADSRNSIAKWEGAALLINTQVSGSGSYTIMDRWRLSRDRLVLTINRQIVRRGGEVEGTLVYRKVAAALPARPPLPVDSAAAPSGSMQRSEPAPRNDSLRSDLPRTTLSPSAASHTAAPAPAAPEPAESIVTAGTRVRLSLRNPVDAKHAREGDPVSMQTTMPIATGGRTVIPSGSLVKGTLAVTKPNGKEELSVRFDALVLPNGVTRDFRSGAGPAPAPLVKRTNVVLPPGATLEMILDRDLRYTSEELGRPAAY